MYFEMMFCQDVILDEIKMKEIKRNDIALTYALAIISSENKTINWKLVNKSIIERWSESGLEYIKEKAWKLIEAKNKGATFTKN